MSIGVQVFLKILLYSVIILVVRRVIRKIQKPERLTNTELGERFIDKKIFSKIYLVVAVGFSIILLLVTSFPSNLEGISKRVIIGSFIFLILFFLLMSFMYGQVYIKIGKDKIFWRKMNGQEGEIGYDNITSYMMDGSGNLKLYQGDNCILNFATAEHKVFITEVLKNHKVGVRMSNNSSMIIMKIGRGYVIFDGVCVILFLIFFLMSVYYGLISGILLFFACIIGGAFNFFSRKAKRITVENNTLIEKKMMKKKKIEFKEVAYLSLLKKNNTEIISVHSKNNTIIKIPKYYQNVEMFETIISKQQWRWR